MNDLYQDPSSTIEPTPEVGTSQSVITSPNTSAPAETNYLSLLFVFVGVLVVILFAGAIAWNWFRKKIYTQRKTQIWKETIFLEIGVPKETKEQAEKDGSVKKEEEQMIGIGEQLFAIMSEYSKDGLKNWLFGTPERFSLELVNIDQEILFWLVCSKETAPVIQKQIIALYPKANVIIHTKPKLFFKENSTAYVQELTLSNRFELPFKTYKTSPDGDPLNSLTNAMAGIGKEESLAVQLVLTPKKDGWQKEPRILALKIRQGQNPKEVLYPEVNYTKIFFKTIFGILGEFGNAIFKGESKDEFKDKGKEERKIDLTGKKEALHLTPQQEDIIKKLEEKAGKPGFNFSLRVVGSASTEKRAKQLVEQIIPAFQIYSIQPFNGLKRKKTNQKTALLNFIARIPDFEQQEIINTEEVCSIWHIPNYLVNTPNIKWLLARKPAIPLGIPEKSDNTVFLGTSQSRGQTKDIHLRTEDRFRHIYSLGGSGSGKTVTMNNVILQDIEMGNGVCFVDPHGEGVDDILRRIPKHRLKDVILFSPSITDKPLGLNMLETDPKQPTQKTLVIDTLFSIWDKLYDLKKTGGPMFENYMKNAMRLVMAHPESGSTLMEIPKVLVDEDFRSFKLAMCDELEVVDFWEKEATKAGGDASLENMVPYITSKLAPFVQNDFIKPMIGQQKSAINFREAMDNKKIVLVSLSKGLIGEGSAYLVGMVIIGNLLMAGMGRSDGLKYNSDGTTTRINPLERPPFFVYIDEMQNFLFESIPKALEEIRKYKVGFYLAHQFVKQVITDGNERIKDSIMANCATKLIFRCAADDAKYLESEFSPLSVQDIANPEARTFNGILLVDGQRTTPFNISGNYPEYFEIERDPEKMKEAEKQRMDIIEHTKDTYGRPREKVEQEIRDRAKLLF